MKSIDDVRALGFHVSELLPYSGKCAGRDLGLLIANCESAICYCKRCDRAQMSSAAVEYLDCYLRTAMHLRLNAIRSLNSEKVAAEAVAKYFSEFFLACDGVVCHCFPEIRGLLTAVSCG